MGYNVIHYMNNSPPAFIMHLQWSHLKFSLIYIEMYNSSLLAIVSLPCNRTPERIHSISRTFILVDHPLPISNSPQPLINIIILFTSVRSVILDLTHKRICIICLTSLSTVSFRLTHVAANDKVIPFYRCIVFHCIHILHFLDPLIFLWTFWLILYLVDCEFGSSKYMSTDVSFTH